MKAGELSVNWRYSADRRSTTCTIGTQMREGGMVELASATIKRFHKDPFEYEKARKTSLKRALATLYPNGREDKPARTMVWSFYFSRKPQKKA